MDFRGADVGGLSTFQQRARRGVRQRRRNRHRRAVAGMLARKVDRLGKRASKIRDRLAVVDRKRLALQVELAVVERQLIERRAMLAVMESGDGGGEL